MGHLLIYFLKVNIAIALFYGFYRLFFYKDTFFGWRRISLLSFLGISSLIPFFNMQEWIKTQEPMILVADIYANLILPEGEANPTISAFSFWGNNWILISVYMLYGAIFLFLGTRFVIQLFYIIRLAFHTPTSYVYGTKVHLLPKAEGPFSFMHWIFIHPDSHCEEEIKEILTHELTHVRQFHSVDIIISELFCMICWFNPFVWLLKREIRCNLEYMADNYVIKQGYDCKTYQYHLLGLAHQKSAATLSNSFNMLPLKNRIFMMNKKRTQQIARAKYLFFIPLLILLLIISNVEAVARTAKSIVTVQMEPTEETVPEITRPEDVPETSFIPPEETTEPEKVVFEVVEEMPQYPGGQNALLRYFASHIKYPLRAQEAGVQGRVIIQFVVERDGSVTNPTVVRRVTPELDQEAIRVVTSMPNWIPGKQRGKPVSVKYTVPIMFRLQTN